MDVGVLDRTAATTRGIAGLTLAVRDIDRVTRFYRDVIGLPVVSDDGAAVRLGDEGFLELLHRPEARPAAPGSAGLYHTAFLLPDRASLGRWLRHIATSSAALDGAADHLVSEAAYLRDPEGNGVEVYTDRPRADWPYEGGRLRMANARLDFVGLQALDETKWTGAPPGTRIGHVHLRVGDAAAAARFYTTALGMNVTLGSPQAAFLSWDRYHHHLAANAWQSAGAPRRAADEAGLVRVDLRGDAAADFADPWGTAFHVTRAETDPVTTYQESE